MIVLIDNYDSFTYNLYDYIVQMGGECVVLRNDECTISEIEQLSCSGIVISPGPETPSKAGITMDILHRFYTEKPILGVCLGHQALGEFFGAKLVRAKCPMHGKTSLIHTNNHFLFDGIKRPMEVMRYHSLILRDVKNPLQIIAQTKENEIMAICHETLPLVGVQFHPESILTKNGLKLIENWLKSIH